jgi:2-dehydro-3-deoxygalactonokinase
LIKRADALIIQFALSNLGDKQDVRNKQLSASIDAISAAIKPIPGLKLEHREVRLASGDRYDVMRGEEVQAFGAVASGRIEPDALICHPGTHAKWIQMRGGRIVDFATAMTGELFSTLSKHGILATQTGAEVAIGDAFHAGIDLALQARPLPEALFEVRSRKLAGKLQDPDAPSFLSGLLIGTDVAAHRQSSQISLLGREDLCALYAAAIKHVGGTSVSLQGAEAFVAGMIAIRDRLL